MIKLNYNIIKQLNDEKQFLNKYEILTEQLVQSETEMLAGKQSDYLVNSCTRDENH